MIVFSGVHNNVVPLPTLAIVFINVSGFVFIVVRYIVFVVVLPKLECLEK